MTGQPIVARQISKFRRVGVPQEMARFVGIRANGYVLVTPATDVPSSLVVTPAVQDVTGLSRRDLGRPRQVTATLQVGLPKPLMEGLNLDKGHWVFVAAVGASQGVRVTPQASAQLVVGGQVALPQPAVGDQDGGVSARPCDSRRRG